MAGHEAGATMPAGRLRVGVFCGSRPGSRSVFAEAAHALGEAIGHHGWQLVYGGGDVGLMGTVARAALAAGAEVQGIIPRRLLDREAGKRDISRLQVTTTMFARKELLIDGSDVFVVLPGGLGTLDEILDAVTLRQLGYHAKPIILVDVGGYWQVCSTLFHHVVEHGFAEPDVLTLIEPVPDIPACVGRLRAIGQAAGMAASV